MLTRTGILKKKMVDVTSQSGVGAGAWYLAQPSTLLSALYLTDKETEAQGGERLALAPWARRLLFLALGSSLDPEGDGRSQHPCRKTQHLPQEALHGQFCDGQEVGVLQPSPK